jgi:nucleotide-binding universal stress UspA family protein
MVISLPIEAVASAADIMFLLLFLQVNLALISLRRKRPDLDRGFRVPLYPWLSIVGIILLLGIAISMLGYSLTAWTVTVVWICLGLLAYKFYAAQREIEHVRKVAALDRIERKEYSILVCLASSKYLNSLIQIAIGIAKKHDGIIIFFHVIEVQEGQQLAAALKDTGRAEQLLAEAESAALAAGIPARSIVKISHGISQSIADTAREEECNFILLGRPKQPDFLDRIFSSVVDTVLQRTPAEVAVLHGELASKEIRTILIPFGASAHTLLATEMAPALAEYFGSRVRIVVVLSPGTPMEEREAAVERIRSLVGRDGFDVSVEAVIARDLLRAIVTQTDKADLLVMGGKTGDFLELLFNKSLTQIITEQVKCPVLWLKEYEERKSFWRILFNPYGEEAKSNG